MKAPAAYTPAMRSEDLAPYVPKHSNEKLPKVLKAHVGIEGQRFVSIQHAARGHELAFIETGYLQRWTFKRGAKTADLFADLVSAADKRGHRWRIVHVISAEIRAEG